MKKYISLLLLLSILLCSCSMVPEFSPSTGPEGPGLSEFGDLFTVHFIDVGQADCALLEYQDQFVLIDGGNVADSRLVVSYLEQVGVEKLALVVGTHPHEDHIGGLDGVLAVFETERLFSPTRTYDSKCFDILMHYADQQGIPVEIPSPGDTLELGKLKLTVLGPVKSYAETNDTSIVIRADFGDTRFLFTGDMEAAAENDMLDAGADVRANVLKVGHHGSSSSTTYRFLYAVNPDYALISCGQDNSYGHPHEEVLSRLEDAGVVTFRTDRMGTVVAVSDGSEITFTWDNQQTQPEDVQPGDSCYIGNVNSRIFHLASCSSLPSPKNQIRFSSYEEAIAAGYTPHKTCLP